MNPIETLAPVQTNQKIAPDIYKIELDCPDIAAGVCPGQFVHVAVPGFSLRRPFTVAGAHGDTVELIYRRQGRGTHRLSQVAPGENLRLLGPLGRGFLPGQQPVLVGGGIGTAALLLLARQLGQGILVMGGRTQSELWLDRVPIPCGLELIYATDDGSRGNRGTALDAAASLIQPGVWVAACGPGPLLLGLQEMMRTRGVEGQFALEERMACGIGACNGCACKTKGGPALVCKHGPVFDAQEVEL